MGAAILPRSQAFCASNIVGYQVVNVPQGFSLFTVTFKDVGGAAFDIKDLIPCDTNGTKLTSCVQKIRVQKMDASGAYLTVYNYNTAGNRGWCQGTAQLADGAVTFADGEAVCINNTLGFDAGIIVSGAVELNPFSGLMGEGFSLCGNMTPVPVDLKSLVPYNENDEQITSCVQKIRVQKMDAEGGYLTVYNYNTAGNRGWCQGTSQLSDGAVMLQPGEAFCVNNTLGYSFKFKFPSPAN